jgi:hypothetical protein
MKCLLYQIEKFYTATENSAVNNILRKMEFRITVKFPDFYVPQINTYITLEGVKLKISQITFIVDKDNPLWVVHFNEIHHDYSKASDGDPVLSSYLERGWECSVDEDYNKISLVKEVL